MPKTNRQRPSTHAVVFHSVADSFLGSQGFALAGDPGLVGMYGGSAALYRSKRGLSLWIMFEPYDGAGAWLTCGREWAPKEGAPYLSNAYSKLAQHFGLEVPLHYQIASGEQPIIVVEKIVADLERSLAIVVSKVSLNDLIAVENEEPTGAAVIVIRRFGENYAASVDISDFCEN
jgi:hypothetical protein